METPITSMKAVTKRLADALHRYCDRLENKHTSGAADNSRTAAKIFGDTDPRTMPIGNPIKSPTPSLPVPGLDGPVVLSGWEALDELARTYGDRIVFHGSPVPIHTLKPRQSSWSKRIEDPDGDPVTVKYLDGAPAISADSEFMVPMFFALFKKRAGTGYWLNTDGTRSYRVVNTSKERAHEYTGYVHVMSSEYFNMVDLAAPEGWPDPLVRARDPELRSYEDVPVLAIVKVDLDDFPLPIQNFGI
ncbi:hypothetical protein ACWCPQ_33460 [Nocardia sp. NPDC001965]